jgi:hypothetical protein
MRVATNGWRNGMVLALGAVLVPGVLAAGQSDERRDPCADRHNDRPSACEVREMTVPATGGVLLVEASPNGGIRVRGGDRADVSVRAVVTTTADSDEAAAALAKQVRVQAEPGTIRSEGPRTGHGESWSVSFELTVPRKTGLDLRTNNGGIAIADVQGALTFRTTNGGIRLSRVAGDVRGRTTNGGVNIDLDGDGWVGEGLEVETTNGGVRLRVPDTYSAHLEVKTTNGGLKFGFPVTVQGPLTRELSTDLGRGGAPIRLTTVNGGVSVGRQ